MVFWGLVSRRAAKEAFTAVFTSPERAVISLLLQIAVGLLLYLALGEAEVKPEVRLASAFAPLLLYPVIFLWKMITVPAAIYREQHRERDEQRKVEVWYLGQLYVQQANVSQDDKKLIDYGFALAPEDWMNQKLEEFGFKWRVKVIQGPEYVTEDVA